MTHLLLAVMGQAKYVCAVHRFIQDLLLKAAPEPPSAIAVIDPEVADALETRAELAAANLREPLETDDFRAIREFGEKLDAEGIRLSIASAAGGIVFDSDPSSDASSYLLNL